MEIVVITGKTKSKASFDKILFEKISQMKISYFETLKLLMQKSLLATLEKMKFHE